MVLDARPLEDTAALQRDVTRRIMARFLLLLSVGLGIVLTSRPAVPEDANDLIAPYLRARDEHAVGVVTVSAYGDPPRPTSPAIPYPGVSALLLPYSAEVEGDLDRIKQHLRDSLKTYMEAATDVASVRAAHERALLWAGGGELIRGEVTDARGLTQFREVPAGAWFLLAWREEARSKPSRGSSRDAKGFEGVRGSAGYSVVSYWRLRLDVRAGKASDISLNDRNLWMTVIHEDVYSPRGTPNASRGKKRR
jgi:hypothetical protein